MPFTGSRAAEKRVHLNPYSSFKSERTRVNVHTRMETKKNVVSLVIMDLRE